MSGLLQTPAGRKCSQSCIACSSDARVVPAVKLAWVAACQQVFWGPSDLFALWHLGHCHDTGRHVCCAFLLTAYLTAGSLCSLLSLLTSPGPVHVYRGTGWY